MLPSDLIQIDSNGIFVPAGNFYIDPWKRVERAVITHAHSDHARPGCGSYLTSQRGVNVLRARLGPNAAIQGLPWAEPLNVAGVTVSFHPAGHVLGSGQVRLAHAGRVTVVSGDYKTQADDPTCDPFEPVVCDTFVTESTFALPIYRWQPAAQIFAQINDWWQTNAKASITSVIYGYSLGKAQRLLAGVDPAIGPIAVHSSIAKMSQAYRDTGVNLPAFHTGDEGLAKVAGRGLYITPASTKDDGWSRKTGQISTAAASGWMQLKAGRKRQNTDQGFVLSDHADWPGLLSAIGQTKASRVLVTHGHINPLVRWLKEKGLDAAPLKTQYEEEEEQV